MVTKRGIGVGAWSGFALGGGWVWRGLADGGALVDEDSSAFVWRLLSEYGLCNYEGVQMARTHLSICSLVLACKLE